MEAHSGASVCSKCCAPSFRRLAQYVPDMAGVSTPSPMSMEVAMTDTHHSATWAVGGGAACRGIDRAAWFSHPEEELVW